ncbi:PP2C family serine/threonine-protein phosphatase [Saccharopolyspora taberi]|uniref:PPM-type phosphatase domain-containing protein n=1 Tax=Saccharopolyspora taberi TaxID=60895 RepID=A0ABN3VGK8_9PSEU
MTMISEAMTSTADWELRAPGVAEGLAVTVATATHPGDQPVQADAVAVEHYATAGTVAACVMDGKGTSAETARKMPVCAESAVMLAARYGALNGLATAGSMLTDTGQEFVDVDGVGALAVVRPGAPVVVVHVGRARGYAVDGDGGLVELTEDATHGQQLRIQGHSEEQARAYDRLQRVTLARSSVGTIPAAITDHPVVLLTTDGVHAVLGHDRMAALVQQHRHGGPAELAEQLLTAALENGRPGQRDNASVAVIAVTR